VAVFTEVTEAEVVGLLESYALGDYAGLAPIAEGVENTNYILTTRGGDAGEGVCRHILTLIERRLTVADLPFFIALQQHLAARGVRCPEPRLPVSGPVVPELKQKPVLLVSYLPGSALAQSEVTEAHCYRLGVMLAQLHQAASDFDAYQPNPVGFPYWEEAVRRIVPQAERLGPDFAALLEEEVAYQRTHFPADLPGGIIHADLFPDNCFWDEAGEISGVIDWFFACSAPYLYDLAICINAWCFDVQHRLEPARMEALCAGYREGGPPSLAGWDQLKILCRAAALRFLVTRAEAWLYPEEGALVTAKSPEEYRYKLLCFRDAVRMPD